MRELIVMTRRMPEAALAGSPGGPRHAVTVGDSVFKLKYIENR